MSEDYKLANFIFSTIARQLGIALPYTFVPGIPINQNEIEANCEAIIQAKTISQE